MEMIDPDTLLKKVDKRGMGGDMFLSLVLHVLLIGLTSFGLYASWAKWGVHAPNEIKRLEKEAAKEEAKKLAAQKAEEAAKKAAEEQAKADEATDAKKGSAKDDAKAAVEAVNEAAAKADAKESAAKEGPKELPLDKQVAAPPKNFDLDAVGLD